MPTIITQTQNEDDGEIEERHDEIEQCHDTSMYATLDREFQAKSSSNSTSNSRSNSKTDERMNETTNETTNETMNETMNETDERNNE
jgi:hypothetical protein